MWLFNAEAENARNAKKYHLILLNLKFNEMYAAYVEIESTDKMWEYKLKQNYKISLTRCYYEM